MIPPSEILMRIAFYCSANILNNLTNYEPIYVDSSSYYFKNSSDVNSKPRAVLYDDAFDDVNFFRKCCPPHSVYDTENKNCTPSNVTTIYDQLKIRTDFIRNGLSHCQVVAERLIERKSFMHKQAQNIQMIQFTNVAKADDGDFCVDKTIHANYYVVKFCDDREFCERTSKADWCVSKCCWDSYNYKGRHCEYTTQVGLPVDRFGRRFELEDNYAYMYGLTGCTNQRLYELRELNFDINRNGSLIRRDNRKIYELNNYCLDLLARSDSEEYTDIVVLCESIDTIDVRLAAILVLVILICACFIIGFLKSILIYELNEWVTKIVACYCFVEIIFWIFTIMRLNGVNFGQFCNVFGYCHVLMSVSRLTWFTVLSYEISRIMGKTRSNVSQRNELLRFMYYILFAVTVPGIVMVMFIMGHQKTYYLPAIIRPRLDLITCVTRLDSYAAIIVLIVVVPLIVINALLFGRILCCRYPKKTEKDQMVYNVYSYGGENDMMKSRKTGFLLLKLALVNVITWIYYFGEASDNIQGNIVLDNVGNLMPH